MDFIGEIASQLEVEESQAKAVAGSVMRLVKGVIQEDVGAAEAADLAAQVPEMEAWQAEAQRQLEDQGENEAAGLLGGLLAGESGGLGDLLGGVLGGARKEGSRLGGIGDVLGGTLGGISKQAQQIGALGSLISKLGLDESKAVLIAPIALDFLKERLDDDLVDKILVVAPFLTGGGAGGGLGDLLGGVLGGR